ncbi:MAG TPA: ClcB-like voltage-gated chloride channel protein [Candidatus Sulfotelmatobacter sp.]|nr:ClcB-like voltage-gated chloride channel protein [Candidatus Sulfotelmatobacter sp.]
MQFGINSSVLTRTRDFIRRHLQGALRWREKLVLKEEAFHLILAGAVGVIGGLVNLFFYEAVHLIGVALNATLAIHPGDIVEVAESLPDWQRVLLPTAGGLAAGLVLHWGLRFVGKQGPTNLIEVVVAGDGRLPTRTDLVKTCSAIISIATGASIGREGGIVQLAATLSSKLGQIAKWPPYRLRLLVGCGAASGMAAAYNAPIAGAVFSALIVLGNFSMNMFGPLVFSSVIAATLSRTFFGIKPWYEIPPFPEVAPLQLPWFLLLGVLCGIAGGIFLKLVRKGREEFAKVDWPLYAKLTLAGLIVGVIAMEFPGVCGNGYSVTNDILHENFMTEARPLLWLFGLLIAKWIATAATVGSGTVGGIFTPTLFVGATTGAIFGTVLHRFGVAPGVDAGAFALVGMGAVLAATTRSLLLAVIMVFELSLNYSMVPALMLACALSILVARQLHDESVYTEHLRLKGIALGRETSRLGATMERTIGDLMHPPVQPVRETAGLEEIAGRFLTGSNNFIPVVDAGKRLVGVVALQDLKEFLNRAKDLHGVIAFDVMRAPPKALTPAQPLLDALPMVLESELRNVPVVNNYAENRLVGAVTRAELLTIFSEAIAEKSDPRGEARGE